MLLAVDTSTRYAGVALLDRDGRLLQLVNWRSRHNHTVELMPSIQTVLSGASASLDDVAGIAIAQGPGSFSALRVGLSVAKGLAWTRGIPLVPATTLESEAYPFLFTGGAVCAALDAGRGQLSWARFEREGSTPRRVTPERLSDPAELLSTLPEGTVICGEGVEGLARRPELEEHPGLTLALPYLPAQRVVALALLGWERLRHGQAADPVTLQPLYARRPSITAPRHSIDGA